MFPYCSKTVKSAIKYCKTFDRQALPYTIDGLVIKNNDVDSLSKFGQTDHHPKNMVAYKFQSEGAWTYLQRVEESIGREKVTPVGILAPVKLFGATVTRANLHNWGIIKELGGISKHCKVYVVRSNDVIPDITAVSEFNPKFAFKPPTVCPSCKSELYKIKDQLFCPNSQCKGKLVNNIFHMGCREALNIEDLGEETCGKLVEKGLVNSIFDLFKLTEANILSLDGFASKSANNLFTAIQGARNTTLPRFIYALGISIVGRSVSEKIAKAVLTYEDLIKDLYGGMKVINAIEGIGPSIIANLALNRDFFKELRKYVTPSQYVPIATAVPEKQLTIVITGTLSNSRKYYEDIVIKAGHKLASSVSKSTSILLAGKDAGSKLTKAEDLGITVVDEKTFLDQF
jgi:DNA ligase (NAD+)